MEQWETNWKDHYATLGVRMNAEPEVIKGAYNAMARKYHPDVNSAGAARMKEVNEAYEVLSDALKKADYDSAYKERWQSRFGEARQNSGSPGGSGRWESSGNRQGDSAGWGNGDAGPGPSAGSSRRGTAQEEEQEPDSEGMGEGGGTWQAAASAWQRFRRRNAGRPVYVDHREKIMPWPSRGWQQAALISSIPLGLVLAILAPLLWFQVGGVVLFLAGGYACLETHCVSQVENANAAARFLGTVVVLVMLIVIGAVMLALALGLVTAAIAALLIGSLVVKAIKR